MDKNFKSAADVLIAERHGDILMKFRKEHLGHRKLLEKITQAQQDFESSVTQEQLQQFKNLLVILTLQSECESKYLYAQGITDGGLLWNYLDSEFINSLYMDLHGIIEHLKNNNAGGGRIVI